MLVRFFIFALVIFQSGCGFSSDPDYLRKRAELKKSCSGLVVKDRYAYQGEGEGSVKRSYRVEGNKDDADYNYGVDSSFLSDQNYMSRITVSKYIKDKKCSDQYLHDVRLLNDD